ncbi:ankyrin repeat domain-containing protein [Planctomyces sp. SH-PL62]|uniref:ankyrin repeat domain-containing protein n=1 Tax=Planctomyces sp. SH-PL62 TaxID=1636152 RepID=UPI00078C32FD|nr:ankyrin repeat domain-containing protein [Planctomyces sp. SH-PL62]AMV40012.1 Ankyrin repeats (3 copies) [Planctomyces sp. SH-PL62]
MEFGGFILLGALAAAVIGGGLGLIVAFVDRSPRRRKWLCIWLCGAILLAALGKHLRQAFWLDEPLLIAAASGDRARVEALLRAGADPDARWEDGTSALSAARAAGFRDVATILERAGATR